MNKVTLYNVIDTRTGQYHSVAVVLERNARWFVEVDDDNDN